MDQELRDLVEQLRQLTPVLQSMSGTGATTPKPTSSNTGEKVVRSVDRVVVAIAQLAAKLDTSKKTRVAEEEAIKKFAKSVDKVTDTLDKEEEERQSTIKKLEEETKARDELIRRSKLSQAEREKEDKDSAEKRLALELQLRNKQFKESFLLESKQKSSTRDLFDSLSSTAGTADVLKGKFYDLGGNSIAAQVGLRTVGAVAEGAGKSLKIFSTDLLEGRRGAEVSAKALTEFSKPILNLIDILSGVMSVASFFLPGGPLVKWGLRAGSALLGLASAAGSAALKINELAAKQIDTQLKSYNELSKSGIAVANGFDGVLDTLQTFGMTMSEIDQFNRMLTESNRNLAIMGGTATRGAKQFSQVAGQLVKGELGKQLEYLGVTQQEQREATLSYMSMQARMGQLQLRTNNQLVESSAAYIKELDLAAQLTGTTRKEQAEAREVALTETRYRAALSQAIKDNNIAEVNRLKKAGEVAAMMKGTLGEEAARGFLQAAAGRGALQTEESVAAEMSFKVSSLLERQELTSTQMYNLALKNAGVQADALMGLTSVVGDIKGFQVDSVKVRDEIARLMTLEVEARKQGFTGPKAVDNFIEAVQNDRLKVDDKENKRLKDLINANRAQQNAAMTMERGIGQFNIAVDIHNKASETFKKAVDTFGEIIGVSVPGGGYTTGTESPTGRAGTGGVTAGPVTGSAARATTAARIESNAALAEATKARISIEKEKGRGSPEAKAARLAEFKARRQAEIAGAAESSAMSRAAQEAGVLGQRPVTSTTGVLDFIGRHESGGDYNKLVGGRVEPNLTNMSIAEVLKYQQQNMTRANGFESTAVGKYQIITDTLAGLLKQGVVSPNETFSPGTQDKLANALLMQAGWQNFQSGKMSADQMADAIAKIWAGMPMANGNSYYTGVGSNRALTSRQEVLNVLSAAPKAAQGGVFDGPKSGYPVVMHGNEAVIPLMNGAVPVVMPTLDQLVASNKNVDAQVQVLRNELGTMMRDLTDAIIEMKESGQHERVVALLESIARSQQHTATASQKMAQLAAN